MNLDTAKIWALLRIISPITLAIVAATLTYNAFFKPISQIMPLMVKLGSLSMTVLTAYLVATILDITDFMKKSTSYHQATEEKLCSLKDTVKRMDREIYNINQSSTERIETFSRFYDVLQECRGRATKRLQFTQLDPQPPNSYGDPKRKSYFDIKSFVDYALEHPDVKIQRIMSIPTLEKLQWARELLESTKDLNNIYIAYIRFEKDIRKCWPTPPILSAQIIDETEMLLDNPQYSYMPHRFAPCLYIRDPHAVKIFSDYYDELWKSIERSEDLHKGFILKDGMDMQGYEEKLKIIEEDIKSTGMQAN